MIGYWNCHYETGTINYAMKLLKLLLIVLVLLTSQCTPSNGLAQEERRFPTSTIQSRSTETNLDDTTVLVSPTATLESTSEETPRSAIRHGSGSGLFDGLNFPIIFEARNLDSNGALFATGLNGTPQIQLPFSGMAFGNPTWSPNCQTFAFVQSLGVRNPRTFIDPSDIGIMDTNGRIEWIANTKEEERWPTWSANGEYIAFSSFDGDSVQLYSISINSKEKTQLTFEGFNQFPDWSPVSDEIVFISNRLGRENAIYSLNMETGEQLQLLPPSWGSFTIEDPGKYDARDPKWSPDGNWIAFNAKENPGISAAKK